MDLSDAIKNRRRSSLQLDPNALPVDGINTQRRGSGVTFKLPAVTSPCNLVRCACSKPKLAEGKLKTVEPQSVPPNMFLSANHRTSVSSTSSTDSKIDIKPSKGVKCFYQSNPCSPVAPIAGNLQRTEGFADTAEQFVQKTAPVFRRMSTGDMSAFDGKTEVVNALAGKLGYSGSKRDLAQKVYAVFLKPVPESPTVPATDTSPESVETGTYLDLASYSSTSQAQTRSKLKEHCNWIRKGELGFLQGKIH